MKYLLQTNIWDEYDYGRFKQSILDAGEELEEVDVVPFTSEMVPEPVSKPDYVFGSGRFVQLARDRGFPTFPSYKPIEDRYPKSDWINGDGYDVRWGDLKVTEPVFVKPYREKFFTGRVVESQEDLGKVQLSTSFIEDENDEMVRVSKPVDILDEIRAFVIGGTIVTASYYKINRRPNHQAIVAVPPPLEWLGRIIRAFAGYHEPDRAFVIDIGRTSEPRVWNPDGWGIVEMNNFNSAGLYKADTDAIVRALHYL